MIIRKSAKSFSNKSMDIKGLEKPQQTRKNTLKHSPAIKRLKGFWGRINSYQLKFAKTINSPNYRFISRAFKKNIARAGVLFCAAFVSFINFKSKNGEGLSNSLFGQDDTSISAESTPKQLEKPDSLALAEIAEADELADYEKFLKEEGQKNTVMGAMVPISNPSVEEFQSGDQDVFVYKVEQGDTVSSIAVNYDISTKTILWANDLAEDEVIKPGDEIFILPTSGVKHIVKKGDSVKKLAKKYKADEKRIIEFNDLTADGELEEGRAVIIPDGQGEDKPTQQELLARRYAANNPNARSIPTLKQVNTRAASSSNNAHLAKYPAHRFPYGWCTWYVASRRHVPWGGNAGTWLYHARAYGAKTGKSPAAGAIIVTRESRWGHVGIVEKVKGGQITIREMNYKGWGVVSTRTISAKSSVIKGYIY
ncbi:MAG: LysM peptidoglycan-binding domain-containing protein [Candidatus Moranbacteria bacterium]|nr:LysM peptidoglycan-binding domain-containing protein [Candidatus Moranbacteria bacterium]